MDKIWIWLDDVRTMPESFDVWCRNIFSVLPFLVSNQIGFISFDHDLGDDNTGYELAKIIERLAYLNVIKSFRWDIHSDNPVGRKNIEMAMKNAEKFWNRSQEND